MQKPFVVIDAEILNSSIWSESAATRLVWFTLLILCDTDGYVGAAVPGLARQAGVTVTECEAALATFLAPDQHSRTKDNAGRRIEVVERGWRVLNFQAVIDRMSLDRKKVRERVRKWRARKKAESQADPKADGNVTVRPGKREQGAGSREQGQTENGSSVSQPLSSETAVQIPESHEALTIALDVYGSTIVDEWHKARGSDFPQPSNRDFLQLSDWHASGIPVRVVLQGITDCIEVMRRRKDKPQSKPLAYYNSAVREEYARWRRAIA